MCGPLFVCQVARSLDSSGGGRGGGVLPGGSRRSAPATARAARLALLLSAILSPCPAFIIALLVHRFASSLSSGSLSLSLLFLPPPPPSQRTPHRPPARPAPPTGPVFLALLFVRVRVCACVCVCVCVFVRVCVCALAHHYLARLAPPTHCHWLAIGPLSSSSASERLGSACAACARPLISFPAVHRRVPKRREGIGASQSVRFLLPLFSSLLPLPSSFHFLPTWFVGFGGRPL